MSFDGPSSPAPPEGGPGVLQALWKYRWTSLLIVIACAALAAAVGTLSKSGYTATGTIVLNSSQSLDAAPGTLTPLPDRFTAAQASYITSDQVLAAAARELGSGYTLSDLQNDVSASAVNGADVINVSAATKTSASATRMANTVMRVYQAQREQALTTQSNQLLSSINQERQTVIRQLRQDAKGSSAAVTTAESQSTSTALANLRVQQLQILTNSKLIGSGVQYTNSASASTPGKLSKGSTRNGLIGLAFGILLAAVVAFTRADRKYQAERASATGSAGATAATPTAGPESLVPSAAGPGGHASHHEPGEHWIRRPSTPSGGRPWTLGPAIIPSVEGRS